MNRRDMLRAAPRAATEEPHRPSGDAAAVSDDTLAARFARMAMACRWELYLCPPDRLMVPGGLAGLAQRVFAEIDRQERRLSVYRPGSWLSRINATAGGPGLVVDGELWGLLSRSQEWHRRTGGAFDMACHALIAAWGFFEGPPRVPSPQALAAALACSGSRHLVLDSATREVRLAVAGAGLNPGSIGKGYALDRAAAILRAGGVERFLIHAGHSSLIARGAPLVDGRAVRDADGWWVAIGDPRDPARRLGRLRLRDAAVATSGGAYRFFVAQGQRYGHTLDPRNGWPARGPTLSATVIAPTAEQADALSTALLVMSPLEAAEFCQRHPRLRVLLVQGQADDPHAAIGFWRWGLANEDFVADERAAEALTTHGVADRPPHNSSATGTTPQGVAVLNSHDQSTACPDPIDPFDPDIM